MIHKKKHGAYRYLLAFTLSSHPRFPASWPPNFLSLFPFDLINVTPVRSFANRTDKQTQWGAFIRKGIFKQAPETFLLLMEKIRMFLFPLTESIEKHQSSNKKWTFDRAWSSKDN